MANCCSPPASWCCRQVSSEYFKFYYHGPRDNRERYYRVSFREIPTRNLTRRSPTGGEVSMEPVVVMDTILVVRRARYSLNGLSIRWPDGEQHRQYLV